MRILAITQVLDKNDDVLGFFHGWAIRFSSTFSGFSVIALRVGEHSLPKNTAIFSLGKEKEKGVRLGILQKILSRVKYSFRFLVLVIKLRKSYDAVFVHMNSEYVILAGTIWRFMGKKVVFWYNHTVGSAKVRLAMKLSSAVCHTSPYAFTAGTYKSRRMPAGIDIKLFSPRGSGNAPEPNAVLYLGRIAPIKKVDVLIRAIGILARENFPVSLTVAGKALEKDFAYEEKLKKMVEGFNLGLRVKFVGSLPNTETPTLIKKHSLLVNLTAKGNYDKTVLEAASCAVLVVVSSEAFKDIVPKELIFEEDSENSLALKIRFALSASEDQKERWGVKLRERAAFEESLEILAERLKSLFEEL
ncbi:MAG: glycosyltransferase family 4 protein [bacterium]|nr:glycosyltransferase family 4 protein [bacterium]